MLITITYKWFTFCGEWNETSAIFPFQQLQASDSVLLFTPSTENSLDMFVLNLCPLKNFGGGHSRQAADLRGLVWSDTSGSPKIVGRP